MEVLSRVAAVLTDEAGRGAYRREYDRLQKSHTTVSEPFPVHRHHQRDRPRRWRRGRRVELDGRSGRSGIGGIPMTGGSRGSKQQTARSWRELTATSTSSTRSHLLVRVGQATSRSSGRIRIASFLHSSFLFSISEVGGTQVPRYCLGTTEARTARGKSRRYQVT